MVARTHVTIAKPRRPRPISAELRRLQRAIDGFCTKCHQLVRFIPEPEQFDYHDGCGGLVVEIREAAG